MGFQSFLSRYVDENAISRRRSQSEDDNPPTPIPQDDSPWPTPKASSPARHGPMTPPVSSNPHTPASPHPGGVTQVSNNLKSFLISFCSIIHTLAAMTTNTVNHFLMNF